MMFNLAPNEPLLRIRCAVCNEHVDAIEVRCDWIAATRTITVWCHGATEQMTFTESQFVEDRLAEQIHQQEGVAFVVPPQIGGPA